MKNDRSMKTNIDIILSLRNQLEDFSKKIKNLEKYDFNKFKPKNIGSLANASCKEPKKFTFIDAGSQEIPLATDSLYMISALSINERGGKKFIGPYIKSTPEIIEKEGIEKEGYLRIRDVVSLIRENAIFQLAIKEIKRKPDVIVVDGPLIIRDAFIRYGELKSFEAFLESVKKLNDVSVKEGIPVIGFVKRPQSKFYIRKHNLPERISELRDPVFLDMFLNKGEFSPDPPENPMTKSFKDISSNFYYTYFKTQKESIYPLFRIDFNEVALKEYRCWLNWLIKNSGPLTKGIPYMLDRVDKEVKMGEILSRKLYKEIMRRVPPKLRYIYKLTWGEKIE
ncbi:MAG: DNA double-strand break repair nuclease NurA [Candidatus Aenigmarchaeota archaeon]|nr:DNA double-strand break repair nuclease NurA [Candidatus Aenigmarchaeota archaeon]